MAKKPRRKPARKKPVAPVVPVVPVLQRLPGAPLVPGDYRLMPQQRDPEVLEKPTVHTIVSLSDDCQTLYGEQPSGILGSFGIGQFSVDACKIAWHEKLPGSPEPCCAPAVQSDEIADELP